MIVIVCERVFIKMSCDELQWHIDRETERERKEASLMLQRKGEDE